MYLSDGTGSGTSRVDLSSSPFKLIDPYVLPLEGGYFSADSTVGRELFRLSSDGKIELIKDIYPGPIGAGPMNFGVEELNGSQMFFRASTPEFGTEIFVTDGTAEGTRLLKDFSPGTESIRFFKILQRTDSKVWMQVQLSTTITQLWVTDGTPENTELVFSPTARPGQTFFSAWSPAGRGFLARLFNPATGFEPWYAQPPTFEPRLIKDFIPGPEPASDPASLVIAHPRDPLKALLIASTPETGTEFFVTDGSSAATSLLADLSPGANNSSIEGVSTDKTGGSTFFLNNTSQGVLLYQSDGTDVGTRALTNFSLGSTLGSFPGSATQVSDNLIVFIATLRDRVRHLMAYDLQSGAVSELTTSTAAVESVVGRVGPTVFLSVGDRTSGYELWKSDGTERGTALLKDIRSGGEDSRPARGVTLADNILFWANDGVHGAELFRSDGTVEGTKLVKDIFPGPLGSSTTAPIAVLGSKILFLRLMQVVKQVCGVVTERSRAQQRL